MESVAPKGLSVGPHKVKTPNFGQNPKWPPAAIEFIRQKVQKTKKFRLNELPMEWFKIFDLGPKPEALQPKNLIFGVSALQAK